MKHEGLGYVDVRGYEGRHLGFKEREWGWGGGCLAKEPFEARELASWESQLGQR